MSCKRLKTGQCAPPLKDSERHNLYYHALHDGLQGLDLHGFNQISKAGKATVYAKPDGHLAAVVHGDSISQRELNQTLSTIKKVESRLGPITEIVGAKNADKVHKVLQKPGVVGPHYTSTTYRPKPMPRTPAPQFNQVTQDMHLAGTMADAAYANYMGISQGIPEDKMVEGFRQMGMRYRPDLSNQNALVVEDPAGNAHVSFRGASGLMNADTASHPAVASTSAPGPQNILFGRSDDQKAVRGLFSGADHLGPNEDRALTALRGAVEEYGSLHSVTGYSMGGGMNMHLAHKYPELYESVLDTHVINPVVGAKVVKEGLPKGFRISRTVDDYASGPGLAMAMQNGSVPASSIRTVREANIQGDTHSQQHFKYNENRVSSAYEEATNAHIDAVNEHAANPTPESLARVNATQERITGTRAAGVRSVAGLVSGIGASTLINSVAPDQAEVAKDAEIGAISGGVTGLASAAILGGGAAAVGAEIPPALAASLVGGSIYRAIDNSKFEDNSFISKTELSSTVAGAGAGAAAAVTGQAIAASAGAIGALAAGADIGAAVGTALGPAGIIAGLALGAAVGGTIGAITELLKKPDTYDNWSQERKDADAIDRANNDARDASIRNKLKAEESFMNYQRTLESDKRLNEKLKDPTISDEERQFLLESLQLNAQYQNVYMNEISDAGYILNIPTVVQNIPNPNWSIEEIANDAHLSYAIQTKHSDIMPIEFALPDKYSHPLQEQAQRDMAATELENIQVVSYD